MITNIVILGAGYAGVLTAKKLAKRFRKRQDVQVTIIDKNSYHTMLTELHEVAANRVEEDSIRVSLQRIFSGRKVKVVLDHINHIDFEEKTLIGDAGSYPYDYLVIAAGSQPAFYGIPGAAEHAFKLWSYDDAIKLKHHIQHVFTKAMNEPNPAVRRKLLTFYVCGAGFTGVEMAGELAEWMPILCKQYEIERSEVRIIEVDLLDRVIPVLSPKLSARAQRRLEKMGVEVRLETSVSAVSSDYIEMGSEDNRIKDETATVIWTAGTQCADIAKSAVGIKQVGRGRLQTDAYLQAEGQQNVFVAGDNAFCVPEGHDTPVPQMVEHCEHSAKNIAHNIELLVNGQDKLEKYQPSFHGVMVSIGGRYGVAYVGTDKKKFSLPSFLAMFVKHFINIIYFLQLLGWNKVFSYLRHEFFTVRNCRSFVGGHFSNRTPSFLLVPLRLFLGFMWLYEGIKKIGEGWLESPKLVLFFRGADQWFESILSGTAGTEDAVAGATEVATGGSVLIDWQIFGIIRVILVNAGDIALKIQFSLMDWFRDTVIYASGDTQLFFQTVIVVSEILVGLALLGGLLTTLSAGYSIILMIMFVMTTGLYMGSWWMAFAAFAVIIGGGRIFGLDYYFMPWLKENWKKLKFVRKSYLYHD